MKNKEKIVGGIVLLGIIMAFLVFGYINTRPQNISDDDLEKIFVELNTNDKKEVYNEENNTINTESNNKIVVEIKGEVNSPNVYTLDEGSRIYELIDLAGGLTPFGNDENINKASVLVDGQCVVIGNIDDTEENTLSDATLNMNTNEISSLSGSKGEKININKASKDDLMKLSGVGESKAQAIIDYRDSIGIFKSVDELGNVEGIGAKTVDKLRDSITVN
ncbi:MAG: helix-hairpin-helix domain-containing protein [Clostridium perfringens]|nr:helix-hairpin-helix domain-containing protein [Clostridium perfringens]